MEESEERRHRAEVTRWVRFWAHKPSQLEMVGCAAVVSALMYGHIYLVSTTRYFEVFFKEMDLGELPALTTTWLAWSRDQNDFWYLSLSVVLILFGLTARASRFRVGMFCVVLLALIFMEWWVSAIATFQPLYLIMERMSGPAH